MTLFFPQVRLGFAYLAICAATSAAQEPTIPPVLLTNEHSALCKVKVGDTMPAVELEQLGGQQTKLADLYGRAATIILFWDTGSTMSRMALADLPRDVVDGYGSKGVEVVGIAVNESAESTRAALEKANATFQGLLDPQSKAFAQVGTEKLPRIYLVDPRGRILWFDIEYSLATRRELNQSLRALLAESK